jgi:hypothetical protein
MDSEVESEVDFNPGHCIRGKLNYKRYGNLLFKNIDGNIS